MAVFVERRAGLHIGEANLTAGVRIPAARAGVRDSQGAHARHHDDAGVLRAVSDGCGVLAGGGE